MSNRFIHQGRTFSLTTAVEPTKGELRDEAFILDVLESLQRMAKGGEPVGWAAERSEGMKRINPALANSQGMTLSLRELNRALSAGVFNAGGAMVGAANVPHDPIPRPMSAVLTAGANVIEGVAGNASLSRELSEVTFEWLAEGDAVTLTDPSFGSLNPSPHRIAGATSISGQLNAQNPFAATLLLESIQKGLADAVDYAALNGSGVNGEPLGLFKQTGVATTTYSGAPTWAKATETVETVATADGNESAMAWVTHPNVRQKWQNTLRDAVTGSGYLWNADNETVAGKRAVVSTNCPTTDILFGDWSRHYVFFFGAGMPINIVVDPYTLSDTNRIRFIVQAHADCGTTRPGLFVKNSGSAVQ